MKKMEIMMKMNYKQKMKLISIIKIIMITKKKITLMMKLRKIKQYKTIFNN